MSHVFTRKFDERPVITLNSRLQPVAENREIRAELSSFVGALARQCVPLDYVNWSVVPESHKTSWWEYVQVKASHLFLIYVLFVEICFYMKTVEFNFIVIILYRQSTSFLKKVKAGCFGLWLNYGGFTRVV